MDLSSLNATPASENTVLSSLAAGGESGGDPGDPNEPKIKLKDSKNLKSGEFSKKHIEGIINASKALGIDPYQALALAWQESGFAKPTGKKGRRGGEIVPDLAQIMDIEPAQQKEVEEKSKSTGIDPMYLELGIVLRDKIKYGKQLGFKDEASQLQAYNGYGTITKKTFGGANKAYGVEIGEGINMKKNPLYGKRLLELKSDIANHPEIKKMVGSYVSPKPQPPPTGDISADIFNKVQYQQTSNN
jgi:hypothetical protein